MKVSDFVFRFNSGGWSGNDAICRVRIFVGSNSQISAVLTDLGEKNPSSSVTNSVEKIRESLVKRGYIQNEAAIIEHYDKEYTDSGSFDFVTFDSSNNPSWKKITHDAACVLLDSNKTEFATPSLEIQNIYDEVEKIRHDINPYLGEPYAEPYEVINRRDDIAKSGLPSGCLTSAIDNGSIETDLQKLILSDLSIIGDFYSQPNEEYICFSEFPLDGGFVDFVIFSGRSRMDVILIEVKGANYNLINGNNYEDFSAKTNQAVQQIRKRLGYITRNYKEFRQFVHEVRDEVESGNERYHSFVGPKGKLQVDPNKDINLRTVVIGGRSKDDLSESRLRHEYEMGSSPSIKVESWDSWIKKSQRK